MNLVSWLTHLLSGVSNLFRTSRLDRELDEELSFHLQMEYEENLRRGMNRQEADRQARILGPSSDCFLDYRRPELIGCSVWEFVSRRVNGLALGYEDRNDHYEFRWDPPIGLLAGEQDPHALNRVRELSRLRARACWTGVNRLRPRATESSGTDVSGDGS